MNSLNYYGKEIISGNHLLVDNENYNKWEEIITFKRKVNKVTTFIYRYKAINYYIFKYFCLIIYISNIYLK